MNSPIQSAPIQNYQTQLAESDQIIIDALLDRENPVVSTKFGPYSSVFIHLITQHFPSIPVLWVDTGYNTRATLEFSRRLTNQLNLNLCIFEPLDHDFKIPPTLDDFSHATFTREVKLEPFKRALDYHQADVWFSSIRRYDSTHRQQSSEVEHRPNGLLKVSPILNWRAQTVEQYRHQHNLPIGPECYDPTKGVPFRECGLHSA